MWEEQYVVYNSGSGHTHLLDPIAALLVQKITARPSYHDEDFLQDMAALLNLDASVEFREKVEMTLSKLAELGLIEAVVS
jgi:PqqD family protein of HPr-rel-A system